MRVCIKCEQNKPLSEFNLNGHRDRKDRRRKMCKRCEIKSRLYSKRDKLKNIKNVATTNGGTSSSPQRSI